MIITAAHVKELRERTGAGMMECKKALTEANGDIETAIQNMRKAGTAKALKKAGRVASEGIVITKIAAGGKQALILEVNCETDFVGRDESFKQFANAVADTALACKIVDINELAQQTLSNGETVEQARQELITKLGENIQLRRVALLSAEGAIGEYTHSGRIGVLVALSTVNNELGKDLAMHIAASNPQCVSAEQVSADMIAKEKEVFMAQAADSGKPTDIIEKMVVGRINKFLNEVSLLGQPFVKEPNKTIAALLKEANTNVTQFIRFEVGEGIDKQVEDFAEAVKAQVGGNA